MKPVVKYFFVTGLLLTLLLCCVGLVVGMYFYFRFTRDLPHLERVSDYRPKAVTSILAADGSLIAEVFDEEGHRYPVEFKDVPVVVRQAFLAAEDADFYRHPGIDFKSIVRAMWVNLRQKTHRQGASTITQQLVKALLLTREKTYERKVREAILSYRLEKALTKDQIFSIYLNQIYLGSDSYGVKAAAKVHFHKELKELNIAEAAFLASLPKAPTKLADVRYRKDAINRQRWVIGQMLDKGFISGEQHDEALNTELKIFPRDETRFYKAPYYASHAVTILENVLREKDRTLTPGNPGGFIVKTSARVDASEYATKAVRTGIRAIERRHGWRGPIYQAKKETEPFQYPEIITKAMPLVPDRIYPAQVISVNPTAGVARVSVGEYEGVVDLKSPTWARLLKLPNDRLVPVKPESYVQVGDVIEVSLDETKNKQADADPDAYWFALDQTPKLQGAMVSMNALTGEVVAIVGGFDYKLSPFNRATQALRQPGSSFKPFIYTLAVDRLGYTPATIVPDAPISMMGGDGNLWTPQNFDHKYLGSITLRTALERSRNVVSVYLLQRIGVDNLVDYISKLGFTTKFGRDMSLSLGTSEIRLIELVRAYAPFATGGYLPAPLIVTSITDRDGKVIYKRFPSQEKVLDEATAFVMANMMKGVVERGTAMSVKPLGRPVAGKTGTTNDQQDAWFIGYTPEWVTGVWVGYDVLKNIGKWETGGKAAAPIFLEYMQNLLKDEPVLDFEIPDGVIPVLVNRESGTLASDNDPSAFLDYFKIGTEPVYRAGDLETKQDYLSNDQF